jgi:hypothetical protein
MRRRNVVITHSEDAFEKRWDAMPEGKLELINGQLIISTAEA